MILKAPATPVSALLASSAAAVSIHSHCTATQVSAPPHFSVPPPQELKTPPMVVTNLSL